MPIYGLPPNGTISNHYQNPSLMNPNATIAIPIANLNQGGNFGMPSFPMDVNGNFLNNQMNGMNNNINQQGNPQGYIQSQNAFNNQSQNYPQIPLNPNNNNNYQQQYPVQNQVDNNYPDFFN